MSTKTKMEAMETAIRSAVNFAIATVGLDGLKATSLFLSNERRHQAPHRG